MFRLDKTSSTSTDQVVHRGQGIWGERAGWLVASNSKILDGSEICKMTLFRGQRNLKINPRTLQRFMFRVASKLTASVKPRAASMAPHSVDQKVWFPGEVEASIFVLNEN